MSAGSSGLTNSSLEHFVTTVSHENAISYACIPVGW